MQTKKRDPRSKLAHIEVCLTDAVEYSKTTLLENYDFINQALCDVSLSDIDISLPWFGKTLQAPLMIAPMTGGVEQAHAINRGLARAAEKWGMAMGVGSQRVGLEEASRAQYFQIRTEAPTAFIFANIGAAQLCKGWGPEHARRAVEMIQADALFLHLNPIQEACQGGDLDFRRLADKIHDVCTALQGIPVFAREVGFGISVEAAQKLVAAGVAGIDCAGAGGTSWAKVEALCAKSERRRKMGLRFGEWGIPTAQAIRNVRQVSETIPLVATGGLRSGIDVAKCLALGADLGAMARPFLVACVNNTLDEFIEDTLTELKISMFGIGAASLHALKSSKSLSVHPQVRG